MQITHSKHQDSSFFNNKNKLLIFNNFNPNATARVSNPASNKPKSKFGISSFEKKEIIAVAVANAISPVIYFQSGLNLNNLMTTII